MSPWESIHLLWFDALDICFIPKLHIEQFGELYQEGKDGLERCTQIGTVRYFQCFKVDSKRPLWIGEDAFQLDRKFSPDIESINQHLHIGAEADVQVHLFRSFDVPTKGAQFTGRSFKSTGGSTSIAIERFAFKSLRRGAHYVGVNLQNEKRIGPVSSVWIDGKAPLVTITVSLSGEAFLEIEQHSPYTSIELQVRLERRRDEYPIQEFIIPVSTVMTPFVFTNTNALMHNDRIQFVPPKGFALEIRTPDGPTETNIIEYNSVNSHQAAFRAVDQLWRSSSDWIQSSPIPNPKGVSSEVWEAFANRFPVTSNQVPILTNKGIDLELGLTTLYELPNILIQLLLQQPAKALADHIKELSQ